MIRLGSITKKKKKSYFTVTDCRKQTGTLCPDVTKSSDQAEQSSSSTTTPKNTGCYASSRWGKCWKDCCAPTDGNFFSSWKLDLPEKIVPNFWSVNTCGPRRIIWWPATVISITVWYHESKQGFMAVFTTWGVRFIEEGRRGIVYLEGGIRIYL